MKKCLIAAFILSIVFAFAGPSFAATINEPAVKLQPTDPSRTKMTDQSTKARKVPVFKSEKARKVDVIVKDKATVPVQK